MQSPSYAPLTEKTLSKACPLMFSLQKGTFGLQCLMSSLYIIKNLGCLHNDLQLLNWGQGSLNKLPEGTHNHSKVSS